ncbi:four-helix bundle copper-binding protein [Clostridium felsineum]|uniref:Cysteine-rich protein YhjQ n=1 Tax=Clostridium felsineum TaxID=36839 RepID=A0A1S8L0V4_9CLOT|nr:four-helix bundle copper-binding protein [Clostridium felsineum]URZ09165.1 putative cysteine-rich protein YhjQ [Clostridium felsineum]URZ13851.1 putative cysteine-rich protein YhjQ [Clostridium felsineum]
MGVVTEVTNQYQKCIDACVKCSQACYECFESCLNEPDIDRRRSCLKLLIECARMCEMSMAGMSMNSQFAKDHCKLCQVACDQCAKECSMFQDDHCQKCADVCRTCASECASMSGF